MGWHCGNICAVFLMAFSRTSKGTMLIRALFKQRNPPGEEAEGCGWGKGFRAEEKAEKCGDTFQVGRVKACFHCSGLIPWWIIRLLTTRGVFEPRREGSREKDEGGSLFFPLICFLRHQHSGESVGGEEACLVFSHFSSTARFSGRNREERE